MSELGAHCDWLEKHGATEFTEATEERRPDESSYRIVRSRFAIILCDLSVLCGSVFVEPFRMS